MRDIAELFEALPDHIANNIVVDDAEPLDYECVKALGSAGFVVFHKPNSGLGGDRSCTRPSSREEKYSLKRLGDFRVRPSYVGGGCGYTSLKNQGEVRDALEAVQTIWDHADMGR